MNGVAVWGDFEVHFDSLLGRGGMGHVYKARQLSLDRWVAVKVLDTSRAPDPSLIEGFLDKFRVEIRALSLLADPRIVSIIQAGENDGQLWFAMELIEGRTVEQCLTADGAFPPADAARIGIEVARALEAAFKKGIIHRDVKPANIFVLPDGTVKLADFGLARSGEFAPTRLTDLNAVACTPAYAAPEQADGRATDHRSDLYSLGCVLYEMITERPPFSGDGPMETLFRHSSEPPVSPRLLNPGVPEAFEQAVLKCLKKDPAERYQAHADLVRDLGPRPTAPPRHGFLPWSAAAGVAFLGVILTAVYSNVEPALPEPPKVAVRAEAPAIAIPLPAPEPPPAPEIREVAPSIAPLEIPREAPKETQRPAAEEVAALGRLLAVSRKTLEERTAWRFEEALRNLDGFAGSTPWVAGFVEAERERVRAAAARAPVEGVVREVTLRDGRRMRGTVGQEGVKAEGTGEAFPLAAVSPLTFGEGLLLRAGAGDALGALGLLDALEAGDRDRHAPGVIDQAIEEAFRAAARGDLEPLRSAKIAPGLRETWDFVLGDRLARFDAEVRAAGLDPLKLLIDDPASFAGRRAAAEALASFRKELASRGGDFEIVGSRAWGTWTRVTDRAPGGRIRMNYQDETFELTALEPAHRARMIKTLGGARRGYAVKWRFSDLTGEGAVLSVALNPGRWVEVSGRKVALYRGDPGRPTRLVREAELGERAKGGVLALVPHEDLVLVYLEGRLVLALPPGEAELGGELELAVGGGTLILESLRVLDRTRD